MSTNHSASRAHTGPSPSSAPIGRTDSTSMSAPSGVDEILMTGAHAGVVGGEEQRECGDIGRLNAAIKTLPGDDLGFPLGRIPAQLSRRLNVSGHDGGDANSVAAKFACKTTRHTFDCRLGGLVQNE